MGTFRMFDVYHVSYQYQGFVREVFVHYDFCSVCKVQELANFAHIERRTWANELFGKYQSDGAYTLDETDLNGLFEGQIQSLTTTKIELTHSRTDYRQSSTFRFIIIRIEIQHRLR